MWVCEDVLLRHPLPDQHAGRQLAQPSRLVPLPDDRQPQPREHGEEHAPLLRAHLARLDWTRGTWRLSTRAPARAPLTGGAEGHEDHALGVAVHEGLQVGRQGLAGPAVDTTDLYRVRSPGLQNSTHQLEWME